MLTITTTTTTPPPDVNYNNKDFVHNNNIIYCKTHSVRMSLLCANAFNINLYSILMQEYIIIIIISNRIWSLFYPRTRCNPGLIQVTVQSY